MYPVHKYNRFRRRFNGRAVHSGGLRNPERIGQQGRRWFPPEGRGLNRNPDGGNGNSPTGEREKRAVLARFRAPACNSSTIGQKSRKTPKNGQNGTIQERGKIPLIPQPQRARVIARQHLPHFPRRGGPQRNRAANRKSPRRGSPEGLTNFYNCRPVGRVVVQR